ncbi:DUF1775 domain-containing protein [Actinoplanes siamensis]|uniref:DUF1775 domain-containing protein n=1 Tax=Actinoplanes siamensis TaxID=1223317 RepID=UPI0019452705|nr:DUF1775 domain-containing protein [Actinoplanes siamensis]
MTTVGVLGATAGPAFADVTVSPASVPQGSGQNLTYHVVNDGARPLTQVTLQIPADSPIAEVYPLSVDDWAPRIEWQNLSQPLKTIHNGSPVTQVPKAITWVAVGGASIPPGGAADLSVAVGPLPTLSSITFALTGKYADGKAAPGMTASLALTPDPDGSVAAAGHAHAATGAPAADEDALFRQAVAEAQDNDRGAAVLSLAGWVVAGLALLGAGWLVLRGRHRAREEPDEGPSPEDDETTAPEAIAPVEEKETVAAGRWSLKS